MKFDRNWKNRRWVGYTIAACSAVVLYLLLSHLNIIGHGIGAFLRAISPVFYGIVLAYIMDPFAKLFETRVFRKVRSDRARRGLGVLCGILLVCALLTLLLVALIPQLINSVRVLLGNLQGYMDAIKRFTDFLGQKREGLDLAWIANLITDASVKVRDSLLASSDSILHGSIAIGKGVITAGLSVILSVYFLADKHRVLNGISKIFRSAISEKKYSALAGYWGRCNKVLERYILFNLLDGLIVGLANAAFMGITRMPYIALISVVVGITNLVPTFGPFVGGAIGAFILVIINPWYALWFLIFTVAIQIFDGYILKPKLYGNTFGVPSLWVLVMIIIGGRILGLWGILIAIPLSAILSFTFREYFWPWFLNHKEQKKKEKAEQSAREEQAARAESKEKGDI